RGPDFDFAVDVERTRGMAILTSSASSEYSQESRSLGGGFFTYFLHSALLGGADNDRNGEVTLTEAYSYVHTETAFGTRDTMDVQTPSFDFDLVGSGDLAITTLELADAHLSFLGGMEGQYAVWDETRKRYVAEIDGRHPRRLALRPGTYFVHHRAHGWMEEAEYQLRRGETLTVVEEDFYSVSFERTAAKGDLDRQYRKATMPDLALRASFGARAFTSPEYGERFVPAHGIGGIETRFLLRRGPYFSFDLLTGAGPGEINVADATSKQVIAGSTSLGGIAGWATRSKIIKAGIGGRAEMVWFTRSFPESNEPSQVSMSMGLGLNLWVGFHFGRVSLDLQFNSMRLVTRWDEVQKNAYLEPMLTAGYRF
ncbi:MAG: hypothetical protein HN348_27975, partial [Proteobacteria bacterium]|nr:hypothetical protein [Pseudomonadota bacterium]